jgi:uncharacterized protein (DUF885 family)
MTWLLPILLATAQADPNIAFDKLVDEYFDAYFQQYPSEATAAGLHQYDHRLEDYSRPAIDARAAMLKAFAGRFEKLDAQGLRAQVAADRELVISSIRAKLLDLEQIRPWEKNPDTYSSGINYSVFLLVGRNFAPAAERLKLVVARERQIPQALAAARANLRNPPRVFTEVALEQLPGVIGYFRNDVPAAFQDVRDEKLQAEFQAANQAAIDALRQYEKFLKDELLPQSHGDFRLGAENYRKKLLYEEMVDIPLDRLLKIGYQDLRANQERFRQTAARIDARRKPQEILAELTKDHPAPEKLLATVRSELGRLRRFIVNRKIVTIPSRVEPIVEESPPFKRALSWASMDTPGPYETKAAEAYYFVTLPEASWTKERVAGHMEGFNYGTIVSTSIHEAYPGHYVQFLWVQRAPSKVRKLLGSGVNSEGWAHYTEHMLLEEGYGNGDPRLRLGQLQDALLRNARYIVGIEVHTGRMTYEEAIEFFVKEGYQPRATAAVEVKRGASDPTYLMYTLGKLAILKLREDYKALRGEKFTLQEFHDEFLRQGYPPIKLIRRAMLGNDSPML